MSKLLSIITVNLNNAEGLAKTLESVRNQGVPEAVELIVVDGASRDNSVQVVRSNLDLVENWVSEKDTGVFDAMNKGLARATGAFTFFLNSGDVFRTDRVLRELLPSLDPADPRIVVGKVETTVGGVPAGVADLRPWIPHQGAFVPTHILGKYAFDHSLRVYGDLDLWYRMRKGGDFTLIEIPLVICLMEMDGLGNSPHFVKTRWKDKIKFNRKHRLTTRLVLDLVNGGLELLAYRLGGEALYRRYQRFLGKGLRALFRY